MRKLFFITFCALVSAVSCIKSEIVDSTYGEELIGFEMYVGRNAISKATAVTSQNMPTSFGLYGAYLGSATQWSTSVETNLWTNAELTKQTDGYWGCSTTRYWTNNVDKYSFLAYAPYVDEADGVRDLTPESDAPGSLKVKVSKNATNPTIEYVVPNDITKQIDLLYSNNKRLTSRSDNSDGVALKFQHALSRIAVNANAPASQDFTFNLTGIEISGAFRSSGEFNLYEGKWNTGTVSSGTVVTYNIPVSEATGTTESEEYLMVIPVSLSKLTLEVTYTIKYGELESLPTVSTYSVDNIEFVQGNAYALNIDFSQYSSNKITFSVSEVPNWGAGETEVGEVVEGNSIKLYGSRIENGTYTLRYDNAQGTAIADYADICTLTVSSNEAEYADFIDVNVAPAAATSIGVYNSSGKRVGFIPLGGLKKTYGTKLYSFGLLSDVHDYEGSAAEASDDFRRALTLFIDKENVKMTCICGDITQNGTEEEFAFYQNDVNRYSPDTPVYTTTGNHDATYNGLNNELWEQYTGNPRVFELSETLPDGSVDHFLFLGMSYWRLGTTGTPYLLEDIDWLHEKLEEYRNERCFVITHLFFPERSGNLNNIYPESNWLGGTQLQKIQILCDNYVNAIWFSGHSHWKWELQKFQSWANIYRTTDAVNRPTCGWCVHVPSCAYPIDSDGTTRDGKNYESQGAIVDVYEDHISIRGVDFKNSLYLPIGTYDLNTTLYKVAKSDNVMNKYLIAADFVWYKGTGEMSITDVEDMPGYIDCIFTNVSQGWYMTNSTFVPGTQQKVSISIIDCQAFEWVNNQWVEYPMSKVSKVGFYSGDYNLVSTNACYVNETLGVQFQTSSSCPGPWPLKLRMKVKAEFTQK